MGKTLRSTASEGQDFNILECSVCEPGLPGFPRSGFSPGIYAGVEVSEDVSFRPVYGSSRSDGLSRI